ncbi:MAG: hypothetical protein JXB07_12435 [Anaerolineae bacterium]|nr:hypothetical protein [Anaerolineae bacterium]
MSIKLDWEVESEGGWKEVGEDPGAIAERQRRVRRARNSLLVVWVLILILGGGIVYRLFTVGQQVRAALEATVAAETLALRIGDRESYLAIQSDIGEWWKIQETMFEEYQSTAIPIDVTGQIVQMDITADRARVTLREIYDGKEYHVMWFYQRDADGWKHVAHDPRFWGERRERKSAYFDFDYYSADQELVETLVVQLNKWWNTACSLTSCTSKPDHIQVLIEPDRLAKVGWAEYDANTLIVPSPLIGRFQVGESAAPSLTIRLSDLIAGRWAEHISGGESPDYSEIHWLESELRLWLQQAFVPGQPPAPLLTPLVETYGQQIVPQLTARIKMGDELPATLEALTGTPVSDLQVGWEHYLAYRLRADAALIAGGHETEAILLYRDPERPTSSTMSYAEEAQPDSIQVLSLRRYGELWGANIHYTMRYRYGEEKSSFVLFRLLNKRWVITFPVREDLGTVQETHGKHVVLRYFDIDTPLIGDLLSELEQTYTQVSAHFGIAEDGPNITMGVAFVGSPFAHELEVSYPSDRIALLEGGTTEQVYVDAKHNLIFILVCQAMECQPLFESDSDNVKALLASTILMWELNRWSVYSDDVAQVWTERSRQMPESLESLWTTDVYVSSIVCAEVLIDLLVERYGEEAVAKLAINISQAGSMDDWLHRSLGIHTTDIEAEWLDRVELALEANP